MDNFPTTGRTRWRMKVLCMLAALSIAQNSFGGEPRFFSSRRPVETRFAPRVVIQGSESLGTFEPTPYVFVRGNGTSGGGFSPLGTHGDTTMVMYGPTSVFRSTTAPVTTYRRGYDGDLHPVSGISFSNPNLPALSPVIYPTRSSSYYRPRTEIGPVLQPKDGQFWIDQN